MADFQTNKNVADLLIMIDDCADRGTHRRLQIEIGFLLRNHASVASNGDMLRALGIAIEELVATSSEESAQMVRDAMALGIHKGLWRLQTDREARAHG